MAPYTGEPTLEEIMENLVAKYAPGNSWWRAEREIAAYCWLFGWAIIGLWALFVLVGVSYPFTGVWILDELLLAGTVVGVPSMLLRLVFLLLVEPRGTWVRYGIEDFINRYGGEILRFTAPILRDRTDNPGAEHQIAVLEDEYGAHAYVLFKTVDCLTHVPGTDRDPEVALCIEDKEGQMQRLDVLHESRAVLQPA
jgi:hypothetical protein